MMQGHYTGGVAMQQKLSVEELKSFANSKVAVYKGIRQIEFRNELPISSVGKVLRNQLRQV